MAVIRGPGGPHIPHVFIDSPSPLDATTVVRRVSGAASFVGVIVVSILIVDFAGVLLAASVAMFWCVVVVMALSTIRLFGMLEGRRISIVLVPLALLGVSAFWPGVPTLIALVLVAGAAVHVIYLIVHMTVRSRTFALCIAALPVIGAAYYVVTVAERAGVVMRSGGDAGANPMAGRLVRIAAAVQQNFAVGAAVTLDVRGNRLWADIARDGNLSAVPVPIDVSTSVPWLERNVSREMNAVLKQADGDTQTPAAIAALTPVREALREVNTLLVADGALMDYRYRIFADRARVMRSVSADEQEILEGIRRWTESPLFRVEEVAIVNALPRSAEELERLGFDPGEWELWRPMHWSFEQAVPAAVSQQSVTPTKTSVLAALQAKDAVLLIVAHSDGVSLYLPNGERVTVSDLETIKDDIRANAPHVFLFSCETARMTDVPSFAKRLLEFGARAVIAPVAKITAIEALTVFDRMLSTLDDNPAPTIRDAFDRGNEATDRGSLEIWIARLEPAIDSGPGTTATL